MTAKLQEIEVHIELVAIPKSSWLPGPGFVLKAGHLLSGAVLEVVVELARPVAGGTVASNRGWLRQPASSLPPAVLEHGSEAADQGLDVSVSKDNR